MSESALNDQRPVLSKVDANEIVKVHYSMAPQEIDELKSHTDRNFRISVKKNNASSAYFVLKVMLTHTDYEQEDIERLLKQCHFMEVVRKSGFICSQIHPTTEGELIVCITNENGDRHIVYLVTYIEGTPVLDLYPSSIPQNVLYDLGWLLGEWRNNLQEYTGDTYEAKSWKLDNTLYIKERFDLLEGSEKLLLTRDVLSMFETDVLPFIGDFQTGMIHGDFHDENVIVIKGIDATSKVTCRQQFGVIDFGDTSLAPFLFDLATSMAFFMMSARNDEHFLEAGGHFLAGYIKSCKTVLERERKHLFLCICMAYVRELVIGESDYRLQRDVNDYLLVSAEYGWTQLIKLWQMKVDYVLERFNEIVETYGERFIH